MNKMKVNQNKKWANKNTNEEVRDFSQIFNIKDWHWNSVLLNWFVIVNFQTFKYFK